MSKTSRDVFFKAGDCAATDVVRPSIVDEAFRGLLNDSTHWLQLAVLGLQDVCLSALALGELFRAVFADCFLVSDRSEEPAPKVSADRSATSSGLALQKFGSALFCLQVGTIPLLRFPSVGCVPCDSAGHIVIVC